MPRRELRVLLLLTALAVGLVLAHTVIGLSTGFLFVAPALVLLVPLLAGRYPGERRLARTTGAPAVPRRALGVARPPRRPSERVLPRGGRLLAFSLAVRPPPVGSATR